jgi:hypothetical protein
MSKEEKKKEELPSKDEIINAVIRDCVDIAIASLNVMDHASFQYSGLEDAVILKTMAQSALDKYTRPKKSAEQSDASLAKEESDENSENPIPSVD